MADESEGKIEIQVTRIENNLYYERKAFIKALALIVNENPDLKIADLIKWLERVC